MLKLPPQVPRTYPDEPNDDMLPLETKQKEEAPRTVFFYYRNQEEKTGREDIFDIHRSEDCKGFYKAFLANGSKVLVHYSSINVEVHLKGKIYVYPFNILMD